MATEGSVYQCNDGRWCAQYRDAKGKVRYLYRKSKAEANQALRDALMDRDQGIIPPSKMTVGMYLDEWFEDRRETVSRRTWINQESIVRCHLKPHIGAVTLSKLSGRDVLQIYRRNLTANPGITMKVYAHVLDGTSHVAAAAMDDLLG